MNGFKTNESNGACQRINDILTSGTGNVNQPQNDELEWNELHFQELDIINLRKEKKQLFWNLVFCFVKFKFPVDFFFPYLDDINEIFYDDLSESSSSEDEDCSLRSSDMSNLSYDEEEEQHHSPMKRLPEEVDRDLS